MKVITVEDIKSIYLDVRSSTVIASEFSISTQLVSKIKSGKIHREVTSSLGAPGRFSRGYSKRNITEDQARLEFASYDLIMVGPYVGKALGAQNCICVKCGFDACYPCLRNLRRGQGGCLNCGHILSGLKQKGSLNHKWREDSETYKEFRILVDSDLKRKFPAIQGFHRDHFWPVKAFWDHEILDLNIINHPYNIQYLTPEENLKKSDSYDMNQFILRYRLNQR